MTTKQPTSYTAADIVNRQFPECVREAPTLYIGSVGEAGLAHLIAEVSDNSLDEMQQLQRGVPRCANLHIVLGKYGDVTVFDDGHGIPYGKTTISNPADHSKTTLPTLQAAVGVLNTSGKYRGSAYRGAAGVHGQGVKAVNALSTQFSVWSRHADNPKQWEACHFAHGKLTKYENGVKPPVNPMTGKAPTKGVVVYWKPDTKIFGDATLSLGQLRTRMQFKAYFVPRGTIHMRSPSGKDIVFHEPDGPRAFLRERAAELKLPPEQVESPFMYASDNVDVAVAWTTHGDCALGAYTNSIPNADRGVHFNAFMSALFFALAPYRKKRDKFTALDLREGLLGLINAKLDRPQFSSQTKDKLVDDRAERPLQTELLNAFKAYFAKNKGVAASICERAESLRDARDKFSADRAALTALKKVKSKGLPAKACTCPDAGPDDRELLIVEGESAGGGVRFARDPRWQEMLPLKGKPMNAQRVASVAALTASEEILYILNMMGFNPKLEDPMSQRRVNRMVILADPDPDGPLDGSTLVPVRYSGGWQVVSIADLASDEWLGRQYQTLSWVGGQWRAEQAGNARVTCELTEEIRLKLSDGTYQTCSPDHKWPIPDTGRNRYRGQLDAKTGLRWLAASELKAGDRINGPSVTVNTSEQARTALGTDDFAVRTIFKAQHRKLSVPKKFYCLTVPTAGNFLLANGLLSANCHIQNLVLALLVRVAPSFIEEGRVFVVDSPEYYALLKSGEVVSGATLADVQDALRKLKLPNVQVHHIKGWGEIDPSLLKKLALDPSTRKLRQITLDGKSARVFVDVMSENPETRRQMLGIT